MLPAKRIHPSKVCTLDSGAQVDPFPQATLCPPDWDVQSWVLQDMSGNSLSDV